MVRRVPVPLACLLFVVLVCTTLWSLWNPLWQSPDEPAHFGYAESLVELGHRPNRGDAIEARDRISGKLKLIEIGEMSTMSTETMRYSNGYPAATDLYAKPPWAETAEDRYERAARNGSRKDGGHATGATPYPPLYYAYEGIPYRIASGGTALDRAYLMRWFSGLWVLVTALGGWLLAGEAFGRNRLAQLVTAGTLGMWPMITFISASVNPDAMLIALSTLALWQMVRIARRGTTLWPALALLVTVGLATFTKSSGAALGPAALFAILAGLPFVRARTRDRTTWLLGLAALLVVVPGIALLAADTVGVLPAQLHEVVSYRPDLNRFGSYLWQFYLPKLGFMTDQVFQFSIISGRPVYNLWLGTSWGTFAWVAVWYPHWVYKIFFGISMAVLVGAAAKGWQARKARVEGSTSPAVVITLILAVGAVLAGVHLQDFINLAEGRLPFAQGRYLFPVASVGALLVAAAVLAFPKRFRTAAAGGWLAFMVVFQVSALLVIGTQFYA